MKIKIIWILLAVLLAGNATCLLAQDNDQSNTASKKNSIGRPDIPGVLGLDFGWIRVPNFPDEMKLNFFNTITFSTFYKYDFRISNSKFSVHPGVGITAEKYTFKNKVTITSIPGTSGYETILVGLDSVGTDENFKKSQMVPLYLDVPLEITFSTNKEVPNKGLKFTIGAKVGFRIDNKTKIKYEQDGEKKRTKQKENYDTSWYRITLNTRLGFGGVNFFYNYSLTPLFEGNNGPLGTTAQPMSFGVSLDLF